MTFQTNQTTELNKWCAKKKRKKENVQLYSKSVCDPPQPTKTVQLSLFTLSTCVLAL